MKSITDTINESVNDVVILLSDKDIDEIKESIDEIGTVTLKIGVDNRGNAEYLSVSSNGKWKKIK